MAQDRRTVGGRRNAPKEFLGSAAANRFKNVPPAPLHPPVGDGSDAPLDAALSEIIESTRSDETAKWKQERGSETSRISGPQEWEEMA